MTTAGVTVPLEFDIIEGGGTFAGTMDFPEGAVYGVRLSGIRLEGTAFSATRIYGTEEIRISGTVDGDRIAGVLRSKAGNGIMELTRRSNRARWFVEEEVGFVNKFVTLAGTLVKPAGPGPHPCVVWTHGPGRTTRTESNTYRRDAYRLVRHGIASLIYDKRGTGESTGGFDRKEPLENLARDTVAGVEAVAGRPDINAKQIGVGGLGQGGWLSSLAATMSPRIAFVIVLSTAGTDAVGQSTFALESRLKRGLEPEQIAKFIAIDKQVNEYCRTGENKSELIAAYDQIKTEPWMTGVRPPYPPFDPHCQNLAKSWFLDPVPIWEQIKIPVLGIWGADDETVPAERSRKIIGAALQRAGNKDVTLKVFPGADHELYVSPPKFQARTGPPRFAPGAQEFIIDWVLKHVDVAK